MGEGRERAEWSRLSVLLCLLANINRDPKKSRALKPSDFDPYVKLDAGQGGPVLITKENIGVLKEAMTGRK
ncbi:MAG TPA: hypothetical protein VM013_04415 [Dehalococcoidia bacterium]|nr:hypothetical protein [Dehalococcoidia bacterium]